jgi:CelD/BcsL family acetyltransferase involved in cellulose biosynthesis
MHGHVALGRHLIVQRLPDIAALAGIAAEWEALDRQITPRTPFTSPSWILPWWRHFRRRHALFRDEFFGHAVRDHGGRLVAIAPLMRTYAPGFGPAVLRMVQFFGTDPSLTEIRGIICRPDDQDAVIAALFAHFQHRRGEWDVFRWNGLRHAASIYNAWPLPCSFMARREVADYVVELPENWEALRLRVSSNMRKNLRKAYESLERDGVAFALGVVARPDELPAARDRFLSLHAARSQAADMISHPNRFTEPRARGLLTEYLQRTADAGALRIFELRIGGTVVASRLAFQLGSDLYLYFAGYDPAWKDYSIMTVLVAEMLKWALANGIARVNLSTGTDQSKLRWKPAEVIFRDAVQISPTRRGRLVFGVFQAYEALNRARARL